MKEKTSMNYTEEELRNLFKKTKKKEICYAVIVILLIAVSLYFFIKSTSYPAENYDTIGGIILLFSLVGWAMISAANRKKMKNAIAPGLIPSILSNTFSDFDYQPEKAIDPSVVINTDMGFSFSANQINKFYGNDLITGTYKGVSFETSDIELRYEKETSDEGSTTGLLFKGQWITCDFKKKLSADVILSENQNKKRIKKHSIRTDNDDFNKYYSIYSENEEEVFYLLTPHMMEFIIAMDKRAKADTYFHFQKDGKVHIALDSHVNLFELDNIYRQNYDDLVNQIKEESRYIADLIDELRLSDSMYEL